MSIEITPTTGDRPMKQQLLDLADTVEKLEGPSREVDAEIAKAIGWCFVGEGHPIGRVWYNPEGRAATLPAFTRSLDAAMTLVPEGWEWQIEAEETEMFFPPSPWTYRVDMGNLITVECVTPALALVAASLRAIAGEGW